MTTEKKTYRLPVLEHFGLLSDLTSEGSLMMNEAAGFNMMGDPIVTMRRHLP